MKKENDKLKIIKIKKIARKIKQERDDYLDDLKRARADLINYRNKEGERTITAINREKEKIILKIISVLDNFERAVVEIEKRREDDDMITGVLAIKEQIKRILESEGVVEIKTIEEEFNPEYHEAIDVVESEELDSGMILEELQKGYLLNGKVIRSSRVRVVK
ncbi:MAG: nucleotide exchange factor GrpE [Patescibacteria group bacterium]|nr:nucleotide exchange factor GrpE [Patescibacteria group bacterium]